LNLPRFIAGRIVFGAGPKRVLAQPVVRIALTGVALGIAVMVASVMVMNGFKRQITEKVTGFSAHIRVSNFDRNASFEEEPVDVTQPVFDSLARDPDVKDLHAFATKAGIVKTEEAIQGVVLKGIDAGFRWDFFDARITAGRPIALPDSGYGKEVMISTSVASLLKLGLGDDLVVYFIADPMRVRKFRIAGIYETGLEEFDRLYVFCDINAIRRLNGWNDRQAGGVEITRRCSTGST
jgi:lipoprotein-releasing system permease protein